MANCVREVMDFKELPPGGRLTGNLSDIEGPSNRVAFLVACRLRRADLQIEIRYERVARPDPRKPVEPTAFDLWKLEGEVLVPALSAPPPEVSARIADLAGRPFDGQKWWADASAAAAELGPSRLQALLACIPHPPDAPPGHDPLRWVMGVELCVAMVLAHLDEGWLESERRKGLHTLLLGPRDWATEVAALVLSYLGHRSFRIADDGFRRSSVFTACLARKRPIPNLERRGRARPHGPGKLRRPPGRGEWRCFPRKSRGPPFRRA